MGFQGNIQIILGSQNIGRGIITSGEEVSIQNSLE